MTRNLYYILDEHNQPVSVDDVLEWGRWIEAANKSMRIDGSGRRVAATTFHEQTDVGPPNHYFISTVFLGIDHAFLEGAPILFETMIFRGEGLRSDGSEYMDRCSTWAEALEMHEKAVRSVMPQYSFDESELDVHRTQTIG